MYHKRATRLLWCIFSLAEGQKSSTSIEIDCVPKETGEGKSPMVTTPFDFIILCVFFTSIQIKLPFDQNLNFNDEKDNSKPSAVNPALNQKCRALEFDRIWNARNLFASSIGHVVRQSPSTLTGKIIHVVREVSK